YSRQETSMNEQKPAHGTTRRTFVAGVAAALGVPAGRAFAQATETVSYNTFLDPANTNDPRAAAQTQMIAALEASQPPGKLRALGPLLTKQNQMAYGIPIGLTGGIGGAQAFMEFIVSSIVAGNGDPFFVPSGREIGFSEKRLLLAASIVKDLFAKKAATPVSLQFAYNELQDGLRAGTVASATFALYRYRGLKAAVANDLAWAPAPSVQPDDKHAVYGFQLCINSHSPRQGGAWELVKFMTSPAAQALAARGGEVVARASAYKDAYFKTA